jgi:tRNA pseudouridine32 synthase/23S rRNA pseudouridine746 synthase
MGHQAAANALVPLPIRDGVAPSYLWLPTGVSGQLLPFLVKQFPDVSAASWRERIARGEVVDAQGRALAHDARLTHGMRIWYYRELEGETRIPFEEVILHQDEDLLVVDKPHFLPMSPVGRFLHETLLVRLKKRLGIADLTPIHRLDRETAGVVIFSLRAKTRGTYQSMFQKRVVEKTYEALAPALPGVSAFPFTYRCRMEDADEFFRMRVVEGEPNSETEIDVIGQRGDLVHYRLQPRTGRKHQLRLHMSALGAPIANDIFYPVALPCKGDDFSSPLKLLARSIAFPDPISGLWREFSSGRILE